MHKSLKTTISLTVFCSFLSGCNVAERVARIGSEPDLSRIENPTSDKKYKPVDWPMPSQQQSSFAPNSLWRPGAKAFFRDQRATRVGDILTVLLNISDNAELNNETTRGRDNTETSNLNNLFGTTKFMNSIAPGGKVVDVGSKTNNKGTGKITRNEKVNLKLAVLISQILPNGNLVIVGKQQVRINYEMRELVISGVVRPEDIDNKNQISYEKIAEARISYGGEGQISDFQQPRYGQQLFDILYPY